MKNEEEKIKLKKLINWRELSLLLAGSETIIRSDRANRKHNKKIEDLQMHLADWAKKNNIDILK